MNIDPFTVAGLVAGALFAYAALDLIVPLIRSLGSTSSSPQADANGIVHIVVTTPSGKDVTIPLRPDSEDSIRNFLQKAEAATGG
jgi:hypothetical protein